MSLTEKFIDLSQQDLPEGLDLADYAGQSVLIEDGNIVDSDSSREILEGFHRESNGLFLTIKDPELPLSDFCDGVESIVPLRAVKRFQTHCDSSITPMDIYGKEG